MAKWNKMIYTDAGRNIIARASSGECQVEFTKAVIGDGTYTEEEQQEQDLKTKTQLKSERNSYGFSEISSKDSTVYLRVALQNDGVLSAYFIHEIGVYVKEKGSDGDEVLAMIAVAEVPDYFPDSSNSITILQTIAIDFDDAKMLSICDNMGAYALANPEYRIPDKKETLVSGENLSAALGKIAKVVNDLIICPPLSCVISSREPEECNVIWFKPKDTINSTIELALGEESQDATARAEIDDNTYSVENLKNTQSSGEVYSYEII